MLHGEIFVHDTSTLPLDPTAHCDGFREKRPPPPPSLQLSQFLVGCPSYGEAQRGLAAVRSRALPMSHSAI